MGVHDVAFLPSRTRFCTKNSGGGKVLVTIICVKTCGWV